VAGCVAIGNGRSDAQMHREAALGIAVIQAEGACAATLGAADVVCGSIPDALDLLLHPLRLAATRRD
jgi:soluble P-type ATPase